MSDAWFVYVVRCADGSLYTGVAKDVEQRIADHDAGKGARYTRGRGPVTLVAAVGPMSRSEALRLEIRVKRVRTEAAKVAALRAGAQSTDDKVTAGRR